MILEVILVLLASVGSARSEPRVHLKLPAFAGLTFANFSAVLLPSDHGPIEIWIEEALSEIQISTVRVRLNDMPMTPFVAVNPLPRGVRLTLKQGVTLSPEYRLRPTGENTLAVAGQDESRVDYQGVFYLTVDPTVSAPKAAPTRVRAPVREVTAPKQDSPPRLAFTTQWPERTAEAILPLEAEAIDAEGLTRVVVEVNGKDVDEIILQNNMPVRKHSGWTVRGKAPGSVTGDGFRLILNLPVKLGKDVTVVALRAENTLGLRARIDRAVERVGK